MALMLCASEGFEVGRAERRAAATPAAPARPREETARGRPPPPIGVRLVLVMQFVFFGGTAVQWLLQ